MKLWRIGVEAPAYKASDIEGKGGLYSGGRWHIEGHPIVYTASHVSLSLLETIVHVKNSSMPLNRYLIEIEVPDSVWDARDILDPTTLPGWDAIPSGQTSHEYGTNWLNSKKAACLLEVPSVIVPMEKNILINPKHDDSKLLKAINLGKFLYDPRIRNTGEIV